LVEKKGVVAFDFDGVIGDSVFECYVQSVKASKDLGGKLDYSSSIERAFREARPLITKAEHFFTIMRLIEQNPKISFGKIAQTQMNVEFAKDKEKFKPFLERFYANRKEMQTNQREKWVAPQKSFPNMRKFVSTVGKRNKLFIATTKDKTSVMELLKRYGISIPEQNIVSVEFSKSKAEQLKEIARRANTPVHKVLLIDDALEQMSAAKQAGAKRILYTPGYSTLAQRKAARKEKIPMVGGMSGKRKPTKRDVKKVNRIIRGARP